ncbi:MAG: lysozyme inhibitor LprI family protein [Roseobacter sp.]
MIHRQVAAAAVCAACVAATAFADPSLECSFAEDSQVEIADCLMEVEQRANAALDLILGYARDAAFDLDETTGRSVAVPALDAAQEAWLAYRETTCDYQGALFGGGSGTGIAIRSCHIELTRQRTDALYRSLN